jgi:hypothetical protein
MGLDRSLSSQKVKPRAKTYAAALNFGQQMYLNNMNYRVKFQNWKWSGRRDDIHAKNELSLSAHSKEHLNSVFTRKFIDQMFSFARSTQHSNVYAE